VIPALTAKELAAMTECRNDSAGKGPWGVVILGCDIDDPAGLLAMAHLLADVTPTTLDRGERNDWRVVTAGVRSLVACAVCFLSGRDLQMWVVGKGGQPR
jgi:hypothetical protein